MKKQYVRHHQKGFTIVELLVVIVVIAILAAISVVAYSGIQHRAHQASVRADVRGIAQALEIFKIDNGRYPSIESELEALSAVRVNRDAYQLGRNNLYYCVADDRQDYALGAIYKDPAGPGEHYGANPQTGAGYVMSGTKGLIERTEIDSGVTCNTIHPTDRGAVADGYTGVGANPIGWHAWTE